VGGASSPIRPKKVSIPEFRGGKKLQICPKSFPFGGGTGACTLGGPIFFVLQWMFAVRKKKGPAPGATFEERAVHQRGSEFRKLANTTPQKKKPFFLQRKIFERTNQRGGSNRYKKHIHAVYKKWSCQPPPMPGPLQCGIPGGPGNRGNKKMPGRGWALSSEVYHWPPATEGGW